MKYEDMSVREIEFLVWMAGDSESRKYVKDGKCLILVSECGKKIIQDVPKYCSSPSDAWPIIFSNKIDINFLKSESGVCLASNGSVYARSREPLRAAMICFLKMKNAENVQ